ncbi:hypothetical protein [Leifsonia shinshuensis]
MKKILHKLRQMARHLRRDAEITAMRVRARWAQLTAAPEAGIEEATWKAIFIVGGAVLALAIIAAITAWVNGYLGKLPG